MIDLHLHTTASDGRLTPAALVARAAGAGLTIISVTDHDTTAGLPEAEAAAVQHGLRVVPGIEITAVEANRDVHVLGYFIDPAYPPFAGFLRAQRADRRRRLVTMAARLRELGYGIDVDALLAEAALVGRSVGRPQLADALVAAGHAGSVREAFDTLLGEGRPAFVARSGAGVVEVAAIVKAAGGVSSLAHPALTRLDDAAIARFAAGGLTAIEVWHSDHDAIATLRYQGLAERLGIGMTGGSDYHSDHSHHAAGLGSITLSRAAFDDLESRASRGGAPASA